MTNEDYSKYVRKCKINIGLYTIMSIACGYLYIFEGRYPVFLGSFIFCIIVGVFSVWAKGFFQRRVEETNKKVG